jgi:signal transduction histidine kinase
MTRRAFKFCPSPILLIAWLMWSAAFESRAAEVVKTNQSASLEVVSQFPVLTNAEQVHWLTRKEAASGRKVLIRGVITTVLPESEAVVVQDNTAGIYIDRWTPSLGTLPRIGELVEIEGITDPGDFAPRVHVVRVTHLGTGELPPPVHPYWDQLINGSLDTEFVEIEGIVTTAGTDGNTLLTHDGKINVFVFNAIGSTNGVALNQYEGALVRLRGCLFASWDPATHEVNVNKFRMLSPSVTVVQPAPADPFDVTSKRVRSLLQFDPRASALRPVKVFGQIVHERDGEYFAMDEKNGFRFIPKMPVHLALGDLVEVVGFPSLTGPSPVLQEAIAKKIESLPLPDTIPLDADKLFRAENDATRVRIEAVLLNMSEDRRTLELQTGVQRFIARLDGDAVPKSDAPGAEHQTKGFELPLESRLELTGVYAGTGGNRTTDTNVANFELLLNSPTDIQVLARPPIWTLRRLLFLIGALLGVLGLALIWIRLLHLKVEQRTGQLERVAHDREQAEHQRALAQERTRISRDLHDDLGSSLTEIIMLATASPGLKLSDENTSERMETIAEKSRTLVDAMDEIVWAVDPERDTLASVARYLATYTEEYLAGLKIACRIQMPNSFPDQTVSGEVRHHLFLAVKEALNNAIRHAGANEIEFCLRVEKERLMISITDNGSGFDTSGQSEGYGLANLRDRMKKLHGRCELKSTAGAGTTVSLELPLSAHHARS